MTIMTRLFQDFVAAEVTRLITQENWSLLTSAATFLKEWLGVSKPAGQHSRDFEPSAKHA